MATNSILFLITAIVAIVTVLFVAPSVLATQHVVGDDKGWTVDFDYLAWAQGKEFHVNDTLVFNYPKGLHNVLKVDGPGFQQCVAPTGTVASTSGSDVITLASSGRKWYICGVANHCAARNQKLVITVLDKVGSGSPFPSPSAEGPTSGGPTSGGPTSSATINNIGYGYGLIVAVAAIVGLFIV